MTPRLRTTVLLASAVAALLVVPGLADAQGRRQAVRVVRSRPAVSVGLYYGPSIRYRPWYSGWYGPYYGYGFGYGYGYGYPGYYPGYYGGYGYGTGYYDLSSSLRLQVSPRETQAFVDGYYAGTVDDFDGVFQRLRLEPGEHEVTLFLPGHRSFAQKIYLQPADTFRIKHAMEPLGPGEAEPARPETKPAPAGGNRQTGPVSRGPERPPYRGTERSAPPRARDRDANPESDFGSIALRVQPGDATVTIDGERWEGAQDQDRLVIELGAGTHNVEIRKDGYRTYITDLAVRRGETTTLNVALTRQ